MPANKSNEAILKHQLVEVITKGNAHASFEEVVEDIPLKDLGAKLGNLPYSIWQLVEHIRITQKDILEFSRNPQHVSPEWPDEYWPEKPGPANEQEWLQSLEQIKKDRKAFIDLLNDPAADLYTQYAHGEGQNLLREALLIADHTSYHMGEIIVLRRLLNDWND
ncbi:MAG: DinB family protein [Chitinophagaceae bacterium]